MNREQAKEWLPSYPLDEAIRRIAAIGYDGVEIGCAAPHAWPAYLNKERRAELRSLLLDCGLQAVRLLATPGGGPGFNPSLPPLAKEREATVRYYNEVIDLALDLGAKKGSLHRWLANFWHESPTSLESGQLPPRQTSLRLRMTHRN
jgi:sugar phosphate isomerase/epimerase